MKTLSNIPECQNTSPFNLNTSVSEAPLDKVVLVSWSGGKDCALSCYYALKAGMHVRCLVSTIDHTGRLGAHAFLPSLLKMQSQAIDIPLFIVPVTVPTYETDFQHQLLRLKSEGVSGAVFGDVNLGNGEARLHQQWIENVCNRSDMTPYAPLWLLSREQVLRRLVNLDFDVRFAVVDKKHFGPDWIGRRIDHSVIDELKLKAQLSNGKVGYYHTVVLDGPIFNKKLEIDKAQKIYRENEWGDNWYWDIQRCSFAHKH